MSLRTRLLFLSLCTLVLPWAGCEYARQMEAVLRKGQEHSLLTTARVLQSAIVGDDALLEQSFARNGAVPKLFAAQLLTHPLLDGHADEWPQPARLPQTEHTSRLRLGTFGAALYAFMRVDDAQVRYEDPNADHSRYDRAILLSRDRTGVEHAWSISAVAPGPIIVRVAATSTPWKPAERHEEEIRGAWRATATGFELELRVPMRLLGTHIALFAMDDAAATLNDSPLLALETASEPLRARLESYAPPGVRISVVDTQGWLLARTGSVLPQAELGPPEDELPNFYRWVLGRDEQAVPSYGLPYGMWGSPVDVARSGKGAAAWFASGGGDPATVRAAVPIVKHSELLGALVVEQAGDQLLLERDSALAGLLQFALLATTGAVVLTLAFAAWVSRRIRRLSLAAHTALSPEGRIDQRLPDTQARDELGDLARSFASLLHRINEYAGYLQTLGSKLSHEFRTPLAIVSSSLDNLAADKTHDASQQQFIARAREGAMRLQTILSAMTEATRVEQSIELAEQIEFDLANLVRGAGEAYRQTFATHRIQVRTPELPCRLRGAPDLIGQLLDKLIDNAVDFCPAEGSIVIELAADSKQYRLTVSNEGPLLPPNAESKIFEMLVGHRTGSSHKPHLGLGLYIVQLIARFHRGEATARNLPDASGVVFEVKLPA